MKNAVFWDVVPCRVLLELTYILTTKTRDMDHTAWEATEIELYPYNMTRERGFYLN
jgi:hypothetical protein